MINIDKIPLEKLIEGENDSFAYLDKGQNPIPIVSNKEYANAERIN